ncbi:MAG: TolC family protein [Flavobacteriaceae bacterium]|nr:TolC family protein [Flavobacteriaceae bacterium]
MKKRYFLLLTVIINVAVQAQIKSTYNIGLLLDNTTSEVISILNELEHEITAVVGEDALVKFPETGRLVNYFDTNVALNHYDKLANDPAIDIIIAFGIVNNKVITKITNYVKPTILFGALSKELIDKEVFFTKKKNLTPIWSSLSYTNDIKLLKKLSNPSKIGVIIEKTFTDNLPILNVFKVIESELDVDIKVIAFNDVLDITSNLEDIDAVYFAGGFYLNDTEIKKLANLFIEKKLPSFTANPIEDVTHGILATNHNQSDFNEFFRKIALTVESIISGENRALISTNFDSKQNLTVNYNTAEKIGLPLKYSLIASTNFVGNPKEIVSDKTYSLVDVMQEVIAENLQLQVTQKNISLGQKEVALARSDYLPSLKVGASGAYIDPKLAAVSNGQNPEVSAEANLILQQTILSEPANANISIQKSLLQAQQEDYNSESLNTVFKAATAYFTALILKANVTIQNQNLELTKYNLRIATENYEAGQSGKSDVLRFKSQMAQNTQEMIEAINQLEQAFFNLNQLLNNPINTKIDVEEAELKRGVFSNYNYEQLGQFLDDPSLRLPFVRFLVQEGMANAPELKALNFNIEATERSEQLFGVGRFIPTVALQGQYNYELSRSGVGSSFPLGFSDLPDKFYTVGLNVSLPLFNQNKQNINKQIAAIQKSQLEVSKEAVNLNIEKNINDAVLELINQISNIQLSKVFEETAQEALDLTQTSYENGAVNIVQLLDAQNNYLQAQLASASANYNYLQGAMQLERSLGLFFLLQDEIERKAFIQRFLEFTRNND